MISLLLLLVSCKGESAATPAAAAAVSAALRSVAPEAIGWRPSEELTGSLDPAASVQLGFDVPGRIEELLAPRGTRVGKGDPVARLDASLASAQLAQAEAALAGAQAQLTAGEAALERLKKLKDAGGVSDQQWSDADAAVQAGRAGVKQAEAAVRLARTNVGFHTLRAPIAGIVTNAPDNAGPLVGAGTPTFVIEDLAALQLKVTAPESASWIAEGQDATIAGPDGATAPAKVIRVIPSLDPATRRIPVEIRIDAPPPWLHAHAFARATVTATAEQPAWSLPAEAVVARPEFCVFVLDGETPKKVPVTVLSQTGGKAVVHADGLSPSAQVVVDPPAGLQG